MHNQVLTIFKKIITKWTGMRRKSGGQRRRGTGSAIGPFVSQHLHRFYTSFYAPVRLFAEIPWDR